MQKIKLLAAITLALASSASFAQASKSGFYGVGQFGTAQVKDTMSIGTVSATGTTNTNAWQIGLGYDLNEYVGVEAVYGSVFKSENKLTTSWGSGGYSTKNNVTALSVSALAKLPIGNIKLMAGPTYSMFQQKIEVNGAETNYNKGLVGLTVGAGIALDAKTDIRATYTQYQPLKSTYNYDGYVLNREQKLSSLLVGLTVKF